MAEHTHVCRDCGAPTDAWWLRYAKPGAASNRCRDCIKAYTRANYKRRTKGATRVIPCGICSRQFVTRNSTQKYCSPECKVKRNWRKKNGPAPQHRGAYNKQSQDMNRRSKANPRTTCWRCGRTLDQHPDHKTGMKAHWTCGHIDPTEPTPYTIPGAVLIDSRWCAPEVSTCNYTAGAEHGRALRLAEQRCDW